MSSKKWHQPEELLHDPSKLVEYCWERSSVPIKISTLVPLNSSVKAAMVGVVNALRMLSDEPIRYRLSIPLVR